MTTGPAADGGGRPLASNLAEAAVNSALQYRAQAPFLDTLLHEIGLSPGSVNIQGLEGLSKAHYGARRRRRKARRARRRVERAGTRRRAASGGLSMHPVGP